MWIQKQITFRERNRGCHLVTDEILSQLPELKTIKIGLLNIFIQHTLASLTLNENASFEVRTDLEKYLNKIAPENLSIYDHTLEGPDDMPAHIKSSLMGASLTIPIEDGELAVGTWQGIYLCEHRNHGGRRKVIVTINGEEYE